MISRFKVLIKGTVSVNLIQGLGYKGFDASSSSLVRQIEYRNRGSDEQTEPREGSNLRQWLVGWEEESNSAEPHLDCFNLRRQWAKKTAARSMGEAMVDNNGGERRLRLLLFAFSLLILVGNTKGRWRCGSELEQHLVGVLFFWVVWSTGRTKEEGCGFLRWWIVATISLRRVLVLHSRRRPQKSTEQQQQPSMVEWCLVIRLLPIGNH